MTRATYGLFGFIIGACFPLCALLFARIAGGALGSVDFVGYVAAAHRLYSVYYLIDLAPFGFAIVAAMLGAAHGSTTRTAAHLRREVRRASAQLAHLTEAFEERRRWDAARVQHAFYDSVTGLPNRALFLNRAQHAAERLARTNHSIAVLVLDLDDFKNVNDVLSYAGGNAVLHEAAQRFVRHIGHGNTLARFVADEFALLIDPVRDAQAALTVAQKFIDELAAPMIIGTRHVQIGVSVGIACGGSGSNVETLLRDAGLAMNEAKSRGKNCVRVYRDEMHATLSDRVRLGGDLQRGLQQGEFHLMYQPIVDLHSDRIVGMEALARWTHPKRGVIVPQTFVKIAEELNAIVPLGTWVLHTACRQMALWQVGQTTGDPLTITVNVSPLQLQHHGFVAEVEAVLGATGLQPRTLVLEITESGLVEHTPETLALLTRLKALGIRLAIDDFGTGYSSLSYLQRFPFDILKIDKSFVDGVAAGGREAAFARTIIALGGMLELRVLAEGIEDAPQRLMLRDLGCRYGQGYLFDKPLDVGAMTQRLSLAGIATPVP